ncbi:spore protease YyaC [Oceanobacillus neutriphilus]|uniref:Spore protease YyaC n=1 Tax=Oceanobacillus neutriphilus TaxID=531815 RepID=A0ABQ2NV73_9BACI|nr:spore protease YyaC [Oceanobacillus neutriphilus]GGP11396.1 spore protease YyaC [Oceanobacillus neutriphilus]
MNLKNHLRIQSNHFRANYKEPDVAKTLSDQILPWFPLKANNYIAVFIGTDRSTGDALGPLAGTYFEEMCPQNLHVYGTVHDPVHAVNLQESLCSIYKKYDKPYLIAIDACLGKSSSIGSIIAENKPLKPGLALNKQLPQVGNMNITGVVNISGFMEHTVLQNTRLSLVMDMAIEIAGILKQIDNQLTPSLLTHTVKKTI